MTAVLFNFLIFKRQLCMWQNRTCAPDIQSTNRECKVTKTGVLKPKMSSATQNNNTLFTFYFE